jgi:hypothetical protein
MRDIANVATAAKGDLSQKITVCVRGELLVEGKPQRNGGLAQHLRRRSDPWPAKYQA